MNAIHKSAYLYGQVRQALLVGRYMPGQRIDPATLAAEFSTSATPVRFALHRLVGEGLLENHARNGLHVPLPTEVTLRDLYDWMQRLLLMACSMDVTRPSTELALSGDTADVAEGTWKLFDVVARAPCNLSLHQAIARTNDRLASIRQIEVRLLDRAPDELAGLQQRWNAPDLPGLAKAISDYHDRRKQLVPSIVAELRGNGYLM